MANNRDNFSKPTTDILAKRVGYLCSNPACRQLTIGSNEIATKSTSIGIAAHITAASAGGPRYDSTISSDQRSQIDNGIWLCSNCAMLIDKDEKQYTVDVLSNWKLAAEEESRQKLNGQFKVQQSGSPFLETDLIWNFGGRRNIGYSNKNPTENYDGRQVMVISNNPIRHWALDWNFKFTIYNNSSYPAFNIRVESIGDIHFTYVDTLPKINNLPPLEKIELNAKYQDHIEGHRTEADEILRSKIPLQFNGLTLRIIYLGEDRNERATIVEFRNGEIINHQG